MDYEALYAKMVEAAEQAIEAIEAADYGRARQLLIAAAFWEIYFCSLLSTTSFRTAVKASSVMAPRSPSAR